MAKLAKRKFFFFSSGFSLIDFILWTSADFFFRATPTAERGLIAVTTTHHFLRNFSPSAVKKKIKKKEVLFSLSYDFLIFFNHKLFPDEIYFMSLQHPSIQLFRKQWLVCVESFMRLL